MTTFYTLSCSDFWYLIGVICHSFMVLTLTELLPVISCVKRHFVRDWCTHQAWGVWCMRQGFSILIGKGVACFQTFDVLWSAAFPVDLCVLHCRGRCLWVVRVEQETLLKMGLGMKTTHRNACRPSVKRCCIVVVCWHWNCRTLQTILTVVILLTGWLHCHHFYISVGLGLESTRNFSGLLLISWTAEAIQFKFGTQLCFESSICSAPILQNFFGVVVIIWRRLDRYVVQNTPIMVLWASKRDNQLKGHSGEKMN